MSGVGRRALDSTPQQKPIAQRGDGRDRFNTVDEDRAGLALPFQERIIAVRPRTSKKPDIPLVKGVPRLWSLKTLADPVSKLWPVDGRGVAGWLKLAMVHACRKEGGTQVVLGLSADRRPDSMLLVSDARPRGRASPLVRSIRCSPFGQCCGVELGARQQVECSEIPGVEIPGSGGGCGRTGRSGG